jgi:Ran GTPase-activating protein (RanGAP) involved in mRNA processing and transport
VQSFAAAPSIGQLQQLDLSHNSLGAAAAAGLAELLSKATSLQSLKLKSTQLQDEGRCHVVGLA